MCKNFVIQIKIVENDPLNVTLNPSVSPKTDFILKMLIFLCVKNNVKCIKFPFLLVKRVSPAGVFS